MAYDVTPFNDEYSKLNPYDIHKLDVELAKSDGVTIEGNLPYYHRGNKHGVLLIHGFTASPHQMMPLARILIDSGFTVYVPRVAGHGVTVEHMVTKDAYDWYASLKYGYSALKYDCDTVTVIGQSNGGLLATVLAFHNDIHALGLLSPAFKVGNPFFPLVKHTKDYNINLYVPWSEEEQKYNYSYFPSASMYQLYELEGYVDKRSSRIDVPVFLGVGNKDILISTSYARETVEKMASTDKTVHVYNNIEYKILHLLTEPHLIKPMGDVLNWLLRVTG